MRLIVPLVRAVVLLGWPCIAQRKKPQGPSSGQVERSEFERRLAGQKARCSRAEQWVSTPQTEAARARGQNEAPCVDDEESLGTGVEKAREKVVKLPKIITCAKGGGKCGDASGALCAQRGCKRSADARARG